MPLVQGDADGSVEEGFDGSVLSNSALVAGNVRTLIPKRDCCVAENSDGAFYESRYASSPRFLVAFYHHMHVLWSQRLAATSPRTAHEI